MALAKCITINGIPCQYHRIYNLVININQCNAITLFSYIDKKQRELEVKENERRMEGECDLESLDCFSPHIETQLISTPYKGDMTIEEAYEYLTKLSEFKDAQPS